MKNKILMIISLTFLVSTFIIVSNISIFKNDVIDKKASTVNENTILLDKENFVYTLDEIDKIKSLDNIKSISFDQKFINPSIMISQQADKDTKEEMYAYVDVNTLNEFENDYKDLDYVAGGKIKSKDGVVISDILAKELLEFDKYSKCKKIDDLIGKTIDNSNSELEEGISFDDFKIEGIYKSDPMIDKVNKSNYFYDMMSIQINFTRPQIYTKQKLKISGDIKTIIKQYDNSSLLNSSENFDIYQKNNYEEPVTKDGEFDYDLAIKQGYKNLIDPDTKLYGTNGDLSNRIYISFKDKSSYDKALKELNSGSLKSIGNQSTITTKDNYKSYLENPEYIGGISKGGFIAIFSSILVLLYLKFFKGNFKNVVIDYILAVIISYTLALIITVLLNVTPFYNETFLITIIPLFILLFIGVVYNKIRYKN